MKQAWCRCGVLVPGVAGCLLAAVAGGCFHGQVKTDSQVEVKPIHITIDVNVHVQKDLDSFFEEIDRK